MPVRFKLDDGTEIDADNLSRMPHRDTRSHRHAPRCEILQYLAANADRAVGAELLHRVWGYPKQANIETRTVAIHIAKLRRKLEPERAEPRLLITVRGAGYRLLLADT